MANNRGSTNVELKKLLTYQDNYYVESQGKNFELCDLMTILSASQLQYKLASLKKDQEMMEYYKAGYNETAKKLERDFNIKI